MTSIPQGCKRQRFFCRVAWRRVQCANVSAGAAGETLSGEEGTASSFGKTRSPSPSSCLRFGLLPLPSFQLSLCLSFFPPEPCDETKRRCYMHSLVARKRGSCSMQHTECEVYDVRARDRYFFVKMCIQESTHSASATLHAGLWQPSGTAYRGNRSVARSSISRAKENQNPLLHGLFIFSDDACFDCQSRSSVQPARPQTASCSPQQ